VAARRRGTAEIGQVGPEASPFGGAEVSLEIFIPLVLTNLTNG
jgi:hypothetical protein